MRCKGKHKPNKCTYTLHSGQRNKKLDILFSSLPVHLAEHFKECWQLSLPISLPWLLVAYQKPNDQRWSDDHYHLTHNETIWWVVIKLFNYIMWYKHFCNFHSLSNSDRFLLMKGKKDASGSPKNGVISSIRNSWQFKTVNIADIYRKHRKTDKVTQTSDLTLTCWRQCVPTSLLLCQCIFFTVTLQSKSNNSEKMTIGIRENRSSINN